MPSLPKTSNYFAKMRRQNNDFLLKSLKLLKFFSVTNSPTVGISCYIHSLLQPIAIKQESYVKDTTDFNNFIENPQIPATLDVTLTLPIPTNDLRTLCGSYLKKTLLKFKVTALLWELKWRSVSPLFSWQTLKNDCLGLAHWNPLFGWDLSTTYFLSGTFQWRKFPFLLTSLIRSTLRSNLRQRYSEG